MHLVKKMRLYKPKYCHMFKFEEERVTDECVQGCPTLWIWNGYSLKCFSAIVR